MKSYKQRFMVAAAALVLLSVFALIGPVSTTMGLRNEVIVMKQELEKLREAPARIESVKEQLLRMDATVGFTDSLNFGQQDLFVFISGGALAKKVRVMEMPESHLYEEQGMIIETHLFRMEGSYVHLLAMAFEVENTLKSYSVVSVNFNREKNKQSKSYQLIMELVIQGVRMK